MAEGFFGWQRVSDDKSDVNLIRFIVQQELRKLRTSTPVKVVAVHGGGVGAAPTVDVQPIVKMTDGQGNSYAHGIINGVPCTRNQGGGNAFINDPKVGDVGHMVVSDRDISAAKANQGAQSTPGSYATHSLSDGVYVGAILNPANPDQGVQFTDTGLRIFDKNGNTIVTGPSGVTINGALIDPDGNITTPGGVIAGNGTSDSVTLQHHTHAAGPPPDPGT